MENLSVPTAASTVSPKDAIKPSKQFIKQVYNSINAISVFIIVYILLFLAAVAFAVVCGIAGISLIVLKPHLITVGIGLALISSGVMLVYFLIKFLFKKHEQTRAGLIEITSEEQPELFEFIAGLTSEIQTPFPKHVYLSAEVNASVFYDSNFWSMFLPVKKILI